MKLLALDNLQKLYTTPLSSVRVGSDGTATFEVVAYPPGQGPPNAAAPRLKAAVDAPDRLYVGCDFQSWSQSSQTRWWGGFVDQVTNRSDYSQVWQDGIESHAALATYYLGTSGASRCVTDYEWPADAWPSLSQGISFIPPGGDCAPSYPGLCDAACIGWDCCAVGDATPTAQVQAPSPANGWVGIDQSDTYGRAAQTFLVLRTGGKALPGRKSLFTLSGAAQEITARRAQPSQHQYAHVPDPGKRPVANPDVRIGSLGRLGADGRLYKALPDGAILDVTPTVPAKNFYTFQLSHTKHKLQIQANGTTLAPDAVVPGAQFCVGQQITFSAAWNQEPPPGMQRTNSRWWFDGTYVNDHTNAVPNKTPPECSVNYFANSNLLANGVVTNWWVSGGTNGFGHVYPATLDVSLDFTNGQKAAISTVGFINMFRPSVDWIGTNYPSLIAVDTNYDLQDPSVATWLHFGRLQPDWLHDAGFLSLAYGGDLGGWTDSKFSVVQLIASSTVVNCQTNGQSIQASGSGLDKEILTDPYDARFSCDAPAAAGHSGDWKVSDSSSYRRFLMFQPNTSGSIAVTLRLIGWSWSAAATADANRVWTKYGTPSAPAPNPNNYDTMEFPQWTNRVEWPPNGPPVGYIFVTNTVCE